MRRQHAAALVTGLLLTAMSACSGSSEDDRPEVDGTVVQPGVPGGKSTTLDEAPRIDAPKANDADIMFAQMMIPHHAQALQMSELAKDAGAGADVLVMADRIDGAQRPEIVFMAGWLADRGEDAPTAKEVEGGDLRMLSKAHGGHAMTPGQMPGMASPAELGELEDARGAEFDELYLTLMIRHHQGAIDMAGEVLRDGSEQQLNELASGIAADQSAEISRMQDLLDG